jgi:hypothetical protein
MDFAFQSHTIGELMPFKIESGYDPVKPLSDFT